MLFLQLNIQLTSTAYICAEVSTPMQKHLVNNEQQSIEDLSDRALIQRLKDDDETTLRQLYEYYSDKMYSVAFQFTKNQYDSEDIVQDAFIKLWDKRHTLNDNSRVWSFLYVITKHSSFNKLRQLKYQDKTDGTELDLQSASNIATYAADSYTNSREIAELEDFVLTKLPKQQREVYMLSRQQGLTYQEIGQEMNISANTVKNHLVQCLKSFRTYFKKYGYPFIILFYLLH